MTICLIRYWLIIKADYESDQENIKAHWIVEILVSSNIGRIFLTQNNPYVFAVTHSAFLLDYMDSMMISIPVQLLVRCLCIKLYFLRT